MSLEIYKYKGTFELESGRELKGLEIGFHTYGSLNKNRDNVVWVCHALTANADVFDWWKGLFGENDYFNPNDYFIVCANILGSPYGTSNPLSVT
jgi:homoserine O-acetyltransferase